MTDRIPRARALLADPALPSPGSAPGPAEGDEPRFSTEYVDRSAPPSSDFYRFAAGGWIDRNPVPADKARWSAFNELSEHNFRLIREILEPASRAARGSSATPTPRRQVGDFYAAATDRTTRDRKGFRPVESGLRRIQQIRSVRDALGAVAEAHRQGRGALFEWYVAPDEKNSALYALYLYQGGLSLPDRDYYLTPTFAPIRHGFRAHMVRMFSLAGIPTARAESDADTVLRVETALARASRTRAELRDPEKNYNAFAPAELARRFRRLDLAEYLRRVRARSSSHVVLGQPEFFDAIERLLKEVGLADWKVYLRWHLLREAAPHLSTTTDRESFDFFHRQLLGQKEPEPDWKRASLLVDAALGEALGRLYVRRHFPPQARARMVELVEDLKAVFRDRLARLPWMNEATRERALAKFERFTTKIGHPDRYRDYSSVRISRTDHWGNVLRAGAFEARRNFSRIGLDVDRAEWGMPPPTVNAYFRPTINEIVFPAGILQPPFFDVRLDDAVNYGGIGVVIGHEITHGYDDQGRKYDADGNLREWWTDADAKEFQRRAQKIIDQFSGYEPLPGMHVNGELTAGENIADLGGVSIAFEALERRLRDGRTPSLPIDGFTPQQRFFLAYAQIWRMNVREEEARRLLTIDPHSPGRYRVIGPLVNFPPFWEAFAVPDSAPMHQTAERRVEIW